MPLTKSDLPTLLAWIRSELKPLARRVEALEKFIGGDAEDDLVNVLGEAIGRATARCHNRLSDEVARIDARLAEIAELKAPRSPTAGDVAPGRTQAPKPRIRIRRAS